MTDHVQKCLHVNQFCQAYGIGRTTFYAEVKAGHLPIVKIGNRTLVRVVDAEAWIEKNLMEAGNDK